MQNLHLYTALEVDELAWPDESVSCTLDSPAAKFMVDFRQIKPIVYDATTSADELSERLQRPIEIRDESSFYRVFAPVSPYSQRIRSTG